MVLVKAVALSRVTIRGVSLTSMECWSMMECFGIAVASTRRTVVEDARVYSIANRGSRPG